MALTKARLLKHGFPANLLRTFGLTRPCTWTQPSVQGVFRKRQFQPSRVFLTSIP